MTSTSFGQKGGDGPTRGRRAETLRDPTSGLTKRAFFGQRFLLVQQRDETDSPLVRAYHTRQEADEALRQGKPFGFQVEYVVEAEIAP